MTSSCFLIKNVVYIAIFTFNVIDFSYENVDFKPEEKERIPYKFAAEPTLPGMVALNIDELIWPFRVDDVMTPPLKSTRTKKFQIQDRMGKLFDLYPEVGPILEDLFTHWYKVGGLVQSTDPEKIENIMNLYDIDRFFKFFEVFPRLTGSKIKHLKRLSERTEVPFEDILYFDTNKEDIEEAESTLKVIGVHVPANEGLSYKHIEQGFKKFNESKYYTLSYHYGYITTDIVTIIHEDK